MVLPLLRETRFLLFLLVAGLIGCDDDGGEPSGDCRNGEPVCMDGFSCEQGATGAWACLPEGRGAGGEGGSAGAGGEAGVGGEAGSGGEAGVGGEAGSGGEAGAGGDDPAPDPTGELLTYRDVDYPPPDGVVSDLAKMDINRRDDGITRPLVVFVHGGSWVGGDKAATQQRIAPWWVEQGYVVASVNFRLASRLGQGRDVLPRDQAADVAAALAHLLSQADTYQIDTQKVMLVGYSSGAHLVALLGTDERILRAAGVDETQVVGTISLDVHVYDVPYALQLMVGSVVEQNMPLIRHLFGETEVEQLEGSPINFTDGWVSPSLVVSVDADPAEEGTHGYIVSRAAERYIEALQAAGHRAETIHDATEDHSSLVGGFGEAGDLVTAAVQGFIESIITTP